MIYFLASPLFYKKVLTLICLNKTIHKKYLRLYEKLSGTKMSAKSTYQVSKNNF